MNILLAIIPTLKLTRLAMFCCTCCGFFIVLPVCAAQQIIQKSILARFQKAEAAIASDHMEQVVVELKPIVEQLSKQHEQPHLLIQARMKLISAYQQLGFLDKAMLLLEQNLTAVNLINDTELAIRIFSQASDVMLSMGDLQQAQEYILRAQTMHHDSMDAVLSATLFQRAGNSATLRGKYYLAMQYYQRSIDYAEAAKHINLRVKSYVNRLFPMLQVYSKQPQKLLNGLQNATQVVQLLDSQSLRSSAYITIGVLAAELLAEHNTDLYKHFRQKQLIQKQLTQISYQSLSLALQLARDSKDIKQQSVSAGYLAKLYLNQKRYEEAMSLINLAVFYAQQNSMPEYLYQWYQLRGDIERQSGQSDAALVSYQKSVNILAPIRNHLDIGVRSPVRSFAQGVKAIYYSLADLLLQKAQQTTDPQRQQNLLYQARDTLESLKVAELENYFQDDCVASLQATQKAIETVSEGVMVLYPISLPDRLVLLISGAKGIQQYSVPVSAKVLQQQTLLFRKNLQSRPHNRFLHQAKQLYDWLIVPLQQELQEHGVDTLVIVADGLLRTIPFAVLFDGEQFLVEKYALVNTPGFQLIDPKPLQWKDNQVLLAGLSDPVQNFSALPSVTKELKIIESLLVAQALSGDKIVNQQYTLNQIGQKLKGKNYSVVHLATHAQFTGQHNNDFLLTYDDKLTIDKLKKLIGFGRFRNKPIELLTMSACQTALGDERAALGLAGVAVKAGARSALATLWFVDDEATSLAITDFYQILLTQDGISKAQALQRVQIKMLKQPRYGHPSYWAPFLLIGNWL